MAAVVRFVALGQDMRLHPDEALFATFARGAALNGEWLLPGPLDKPPLSIYATAVSMALLMDGEAAPGLPDISPHRGEFAARFPNVLISLLTAALAYRLGWALYRSRSVALAALALVAFAPYSTAFADTAFTDGWLLLLLTASLTTIALGRWGWAGVWFGLALWSKPQALFMLPLIGALGWLVDTRPALWRRGLAFVLALVVLAGLLVVWDAARGQTAGLWALAATNNAPWRLLRPDEVWRRLDVGLSQAGWLLGLPVVTMGLVVLGAGTALVQAVRRPGRRSNAIDLLLLTFVLGYGGLHWLVAFDLYDRYWLLLLIPLALLAARGVDGVLRTMTRRQFVLYSRSAIYKMGKARLAPTRRFWFFRTRTLMALGLGAILVYGGWLGATGQVPVGGDRGAHDEIDEAAAFLNSRTLGAIIYDHWLGWELDYYLGKWTNKRRVYYPSTASLAADALRQPDPAPRYFIAPADVPHALWLDALSAAGFRIERVAGDRFVIYELLPPWAEVSD
jgi:4-amino-4-deoxy-L-arabinose transferase-like glycosyltransferase